MAAFWLKVIASDHVFYNGNCESLVVPAHDGEVGILPHREAMILAIQEGELRFRVPGENQYREAVVGIGIVQVANNRVTVVVDTAERPEDIDEVRVPGFKGGFLLRADLHVTDCIGAFPLVSQIGRAHV